MNQNEQGIIKVPFAKDPVNFGDYDPSRPGGYNRLNRCNLFGCEYESLIDGNTNPPAVWDGGKVITTSEGWRLVLGNPEAWLMTLDKPASTGTGGDQPYNGMGRVVLKKNMVNIAEEGEPEIIVNLLTQEMFQDGEGNDLENTVFVIQYDYDLNSETITIPENCVLEFDGGGFSNGTLALSNTIFTGDYDRKVNVTLTGTNITNDYRVYSCEDTISHISTARNSIVLMDSFDADANIALYTNIRGANKGVTITFTTQAIALYSNNITIENLHIKKDIPVSTTKSVRHAIKSGDDIGFNNIVIRNCIIEGALSFTNDDAVDNAGNIDIYDNVINCDFGNIDLSHTSDNQKDLFTFRAVSNIHIHNNTIIGLELCRLFKSSGLFYTDPASIHYDNVNDIYTTTISHNPTNINISNNKITCHNSGTTGVGKQLFDLFAGTLDVTIKDNFIDSYGHSYVIEDKTITGSDVSEQTIVYFTGVPESSIFISGNKIVNAQRFIAYRPNNENSTAIIYDNDVSASASMFLLGNCNGRIKGNIFRGVNASNVLGSTISVKKVSGGDPGEAGVCNECIIDSNFFFCKQISLYNCKDTLLTNNIYRALAGNESKYYILNIYGNDGAYTGRKVTLLNSVGDKIVYAIAISNQYMPIGANNENEAEIPDFIVNCLDTTHNFINIINYTDAQVAYVYSKVTSIYPLKVVKNGIASYIMACQPDPSVRLSGDTSNRPKGKKIYEGFIYFDTDINKPIFAKAISGDAVTWVDALGNPVNTVYPKVIGTPTTGNLVNFNGMDIEDAGSKPADYAKISGILTDGNFAGFDASGNIVDSGKKPADFAPAQS